MPHSIMAVIDDLNLPNSKPSFIELVEFGDIKKVDVVDLVVTQYEVEHRGRSLTEAERERLQLRCLTIAPFART